MIISTKATKQAEFNAAMILYNTQKRYTLFNTAIATSNVILQILLLKQVFGVPLQFGVWLMSLISAYVIADLLNGAIHMIMDHNQNYTSIYGPLVAHFHLHHQTPKYTRKWLPVIYFQESGAKIWLVPYLVCVLLLLHYSLVNPFLIHLLVYIGIFSSVAEVSHYLCHTSESKKAKFLAKIGLLLSRDHHAPHHEQNNTNYAFLNGFSDPLLNRLAKWIYPGYKDTTDTHFAKYSPASESR